MRLVVQRVNFASVIVAEKEIAAIKKGLLVLLGFHQDDEEVAFDTAIRKLCEMRIFPDDSGRFDKSLQDIDGEILLVPQFTLFADTAKGRRPDFFSAMKPDLAKIKFSDFFESLKIKHPKSRMGEFGADMQVNLQNDGPVTILLDF